VRGFRIVCLYFQNGELASRDAECGGALIATGEIGNTGIGACVFVPDGANAPNLSQLPRLPGLPGPVG
jgi:hypothetical protein